MTKKICLAAFVMYVFLGVNDGVNAANSEVPEPFQGFDASSAYTINYDDLNALLKVLVLDVGRSNREKAKPTRAKTGTRMQVKVKKTTVNEGNRFYFEAFKNDEVIRQQLSDMQNSLEQIPAEVPLEIFSRDEQLAYWLNLYNFTVLNEIVKVYPKRNLRKMLVGNDSILSKKLLTVAGIPLSLNDIQFIILNQNYNNNPLIIYGLYQGIIGGPNIRDRAYTAGNVFRNLEKNAAEFVNSNRGTYAKSTKVFQVSSLYGRNKAYFNDFIPDLTEHLLRYLEGDEHGELQVAPKVTADIDDWTVTDLYGTYHEIGGSIADSSAALIGAIRSTSQVDGQSVTTVATIESAAFAAKSQPLNRFSPELLTHLKELNIKRENTAIKNARVTIEELGAVSENTEEKENQ